MKKILAILLLSLILAPVKSTSSASLTTSLLAEDSEKQAIPSNSNLDFFKVADHLDETLNLENVWKSIPPEKLNAKIIIAVLDTGIDTENKYFKTYDTLVKGADFLSPAAAGQAQDASAGEDVTDLNGHGTMVAGVIFKICPWAKIMPVRVAEPVFGWSEHKLLAQGIIWAADHKARIICIPIGGWMGSQTLKDAVKYAYEKNCVIIASSGSSAGANQDFYPAGYYDYVISVTSADERGIIAENANLTPQTHLAAPGEVYTSSLNNEFGWLSGSSAATAVVAGMAGLILTQNPQLPPQRVKQIMRQSGELIPIDNFYPFFKAKLVNPAKTFSLTPVEISDRSIAELSCWPNEPLPEQSVYLFARVANWGNAKLPPSRLQVTLDKKVVLHNNQDWIPVPALEPAEDFEITLTALSPKEPGKYPIAASLELQPGETNINNNVVIQEIEVITEQIRQVEITEIETSEAMAGKNGLDFILTVQNRGNINEKEVIITGAVEGTLPEQDFELKAGETKQIKLPWQRTNPGGQVFTFTAGCYLDEKNENGFQDEVTLNFHFDPTITLVR
ncbi:MAG: S8 family serine peptidase [Planctomycetota bacterium]